MDGGDSRAPEALVRAMGPVGFLRPLPRAEYARVWNAAREGRALTQDEEFLARAMRRHPEWGGCWEGSGAEAEAFRFRKSG